MVERRCAGCGASITKLADARRVDRFCSYRCRDDFLYGPDRRGNISTELIYVGPRNYCSVPERHPSRNAHLKRRIWCAGPCAWCGESFTIADQISARYCSIRCARGASKASRHEGFYVSPTIRLAIYERDGWVCQLCFEPVDRTDTFGDWAPSLDHIECQSWTSEPDHSPENLRLAHRWCNAVRGDERYYTAADLICA